MKNKFRKFFALFLVMTILIVSGFGCKKETTSYKVDLEVWGVMDDSDAYSEVFEQYKKINPNIGNITYKKQRIDSYDRDLVDAMASGSGPDIFMIRNNSVDNYLNKIVSAPKDIFSEKRFRSNFVDVCASDFINEKGEIYATPLSVNSLALFYNVDMFNSAGITAPPKTWEELIEISRKLTKVNSVGEINPAGIAMGTAYNISRSTDILAMLMLQNGADFKSSSALRDPGSLQKALGFYLDFASISSPNYSWNSRVHHSVDAFSEGALAMMISYSWQADVIKAKSPKLHYAVSDVPQMNPTYSTNYANYWGYVVASNKIPKPSTASGTNVRTKTKTVPVSNDIRIREAWKFLTYLTTRPDAQVTSSKTEKPATVFDPAWAYLTKTNQPAARKDLIERQKENASLDPFARGNLVAKSWRQKNPTEVEQALGEMIDNINRGAMNVGDAISLALGKIGRAGQ